jgi:polyphenol oxidase
MKNKNIEFTFFDKSFKHSSHVYGLHRFKLTEHEKRQVVLDNYQAILKTLQGKHLLILHHVYGNTVIDADVIDNFSHEPDADAAVTSKPGIILSVQSADCIPVLLADNDSNIIGAAHCSWRCVKDNLLANIIQMMKNKGAKNISAIIGPGIAQHSYEVDQPFYDIILTSAPKAKSLFIPAPKAQHFLFDLPGFCVLKLQQSGVVDIMNVSEDTYQNENKYYSFRRDTHLGIKGNKGNLLSTIMIRES